MTHPKTDHELRQLHEDVLTELAKREKSLVGCDCSANRPGYGPDHCWERDVMVPSWRDRWTRHCPGVVISDPTCSPNECIWCTEDGFVEWPCTEALAVILETEYREDE